jgi:hypothetical protein
MKLATNIAKMLLVLQEARDDKARANSRLLTMAIL